MKRVTFLIFMVLIPIFGSAQKIVKDTNNVKNPKEGLFYYMSKNKTMYLYRDSFRVFDEPKANVNPETPPNPSPILAEIPLGSWNGPERILVAKLIDGEYYIMQRDALETYLVPRGKNILNDSRTRINSDIFTGNIVPKIKSQNSELGGLYPPSNFPEDKLLKLGYHKNSSGEFVKSITEIIPPVINPILPTPQNPAKISIPVGLIMWDNWTYDYWNDANPKYDILINHISRNRYTATYFKDKFELVPFWGQHTSPERIKIRYNVKWNNELGRNTYDEVEKYVEVKYDKTPQDTEKEVRFYRDAGFDFLLFNYYSKESYLSETRRHFEEMPDKMGMKMSVMILSGRTENEINEITENMTKDFWLKIDNKPVLYLVDNNFVDLPKYRSSLKSKNGSDIYVVYYHHNGYPTDWSDYLQKRPNSISAYNTSIGGNSTAEQQINKEISDRESWMGQFKNTGITLIPVLSLGSESLDKRTDLGYGDEQPGIIESANNEQVNRKFDLVKDFIQKYPNQVPAIIWYSATEINEGARSFVTKKRRDGTLDNTLLQIARMHLE